MAQLMAPTNVIAGINQEITSHSKKSLEPQVCNLVAQISLSPRSAFRADCTGEAAGK
jgi:hypothetical protein